MRGLSPRREPLIPLRYREGTFSYKGRGKELFLAYSVLTRARQRDSKLSSSSIRACAFIGSLRFSATMLTGGATLTLACAGSAAGHLSADFGITVLPAY